MNLRRAQLLGEYNRFMGLGATTPSTTTTDAAVTTPTAAPFTLESLVKYVAENQGAAVIVVGLALIYVFWKDILGRGIDE